MQVGARGPSFARFEAFALNMRTGELCHDCGKVIRLSEQPFQILAILLERPGEVVSREEIRKRLWPNDTVVEFEHSISAAMNRLRQALGDSASESTYIETLARRGYRWMRSVEWVDDGKRPVLVEERPAPPASPSTSHIGRKVSHYRVLEFVGGGGMGVVYKAEDIKLARRVALKFLPEELSGDQHALERIFSLAYDSLLRCPFETICERFSRLSIFHKGCGIDIPADPFGTAGWPASLPIFGDHTPISNEMSAIVY
jgi:eukaryotic-like serine/threonine-protein kinase